MKNTVSFTSKAKLAFILLLLSACQPKGNFGAVDYAQNESGEYLTNISQVVNNKENFRIRNESAIESLEQNNIINQSITKRAVLVSKTDLILKQSHSDQAAPLGYTLKPLTEVQVQWPTNIANNHIEVVWMSPTGEGIKGWLKYLDSRKRAQIKLLENLIVNNVVLENAEILFAKDFETSSVKPNVQATEVSVSLSTQHPNTSEEEVITNSDHNHIHTPEINTTPLDIDFTRLGEDLNFSVPTVDQTESIVEKLGIRQVKYPYPLEKSQAQIETISSSKTFSGCGFKPSLGGQNGTDCYKNLTLSAEFIDFLKIHGHQCSVFAAKNTFNKTPHHVQFTSNGGSLNRSDKSSLHHRGRALDIFKAQIFWDEDGDSNREIKFNKNEVDGDSNVEKENFKFYWSFVGCWRNRIRTFSPKSCSVNKSAGVLTYRYDQAHENHIHIALPLTDEKKKQYKTKCF